MAINAKTREEIQNANSQLNTRARFQTPILTSPSQVAFLPFYTLGEGYEATPGEDNGAVVSNWRWYSSSRTSFGSLPAKRLRQSLLPASRLQKTAHLCAGRLACCLRYVRTGKGAGKPWMQTRPFARRSSFTQTSLRWITKCLARMAPGRQQHL